MLTPNSQSLARIGDFAQQPFEPLAQLGPDRIEQLYVVIREEVLDVDRIEARRTRFLDHIDEVQPRLDDEGTELMRSALAESQRQEIEVPGGIEAPGEEIFHVGDLSCELGV